MRHEGLLGIAGICILSVQALATLDAQVIERVNVRDDGSEDPGGADDGGVGLGGALAISDDGRFVLFATHGSLSPTLDQNGNGFDYYVRDRVARRTHLLSSGTATPVTAPEAALSGDGRVAAFVDATGPAAPRPVGLFVKPVEGGSPTLSDIGPDGELNVLGVRALHLSADGNVLIFDGGFFLGSLDGQPTNEFRAGIFRRNLAARTTEPFQTIDVFGRGYPRPLAISDDAETVVYYPTVPPLDRLLVQRGAGIEPLEILGNIAVPVLSGNGRYLALVLLDGDRAILLIDLEGDPTPRFVGEGTSFALPSLSLSRDGRYLAFMTTEQIDPRDTNLVRDVYLWDRDDDAYLYFASGPTYEIALSRDGSTLALTSGGSSLVPGDTNAKADVFIAVPGMLGVTLAGPRQVFVGERGQFLATGTNRGITTARDVSLFVFREILALSIFSAPEPSQGTCDPTAPDAMACSLGDLPPGATSAVSFDLLSLGVEIVPFFAMIGISIPGIHVPQRPKTAEPALEQSCRGVGEGIGAARSYAGAPSAHPTGKNQALLRAGGQGPAAIQPCVGGGSWQGRSLPSCSRAPEPASTEV